MNKVRAIAQIFRRAYSSNVNVGIKEELCVAQHSEPFVTDECDLQNQGENRTNIPEVHENDTIKQKELSLESEKKLLTFRQFTKDRLRELYKGSPEKGITLLYEYNKYVEANKNTSTSAVQENSANSDAS